MHSFNFVRSDGSLTRDRFQARAIDNNVRWTVGPNFDLYDFKQSLECTYEQLIEQRWQQLKSKYSYIRLWFSGGRDSRLVLDSAIKHGVHIDEIVIIRPSMFPTNIRILQLAEQDRNAVHYLETIQSLIPTTKINIINFQDHHYAQVFANPDWHHYNNVWMIFVPWTVQNSMPMFADEFGFKNHYNAVDLMGTIHPHIWYDQGWRFQFIDSQFQDLGTSVEIFNVTNDMPELIHCYVRDCASYLESQHIYPQRFQDSVNDIRNQISVYKNIELPDPSTQFPKRWEHSWRPHNNIYYKINSGFKSTLLLMLCEQQLPQPQGYQNYINCTNWAEIEQEYHHGGICSLEFQL